MNDPTFNILMEIANTLKSIDERLRDLCTTNKLIRDTVAAINTKTSDKGDF